MAEALHDTDAQATVEAGGTTLVTGDGVRLAARSWVPAGPVAARATVVLVHGFSASKDDANLVILAGRLAQSGCAVVSYDARGHGDSGGFCTLGDLEHHDVAAAVGWARRQRTPIVVVGTSMGGVAALRYAASGADMAGVAGVVTVSSPAEWRMPMRARALLTGGLTRTKAGRWVSARHLRVRINPVWTSPEPPLSLAARVTTPLAIVHGQRDRLIPPSAAIDLYSGAAGKRQLLLVPEMGHAFDRVGHGAICDAVDWVLQESSEAQVG